MHPRDFLMDSQAGAILLPVCDHFSGVEVRMKKSLQLQAEYAAEFQTCVFDASLDCEDGAPVGGEADQAQMVTEIANQAYLQWQRNGLKDVARIAVRVHPVHHLAFESDIESIVGGAGKSLCHVMIPKVESRNDVDVAVAAIDRAALLCGRIEPMPLHVLIESSAAVQHAFEIAAHPRVQSLSFGLMDFVSSHGGAIPASAIETHLQSTAFAIGQFNHPLVVRAKLEMAAACHAHGKVPSHCVVTEFNNTGLVASAAKKANQEFGYTRMWSIHPAQIRPILQAMAPAMEEVERAAEIIAAADLAHWAPVSHASQLHDRASYRYFWHLLERAHQAGCALPQSVHKYFSDIQLETASC
jgi:citrate lyase subunit beta / citryl-CoA lyase